MDDQEAEEMVGKIPMHYAYFRKNEDCGIPQDDVCDRVTSSDSEIEERIPNVINRRSVYNLQSVREATTFEDLYDALCDFKVNLESTQVIDKVTVTMDVRTSFFVYLKSSGCSHWKR